MSKQPQADPAARSRRILLVDRHALMRRAVADWIDCCSHLKICGTAAGVGQAFEAVERLRPALVISEIMQPDDLGFIRELHRRHPRLPILVFSMQDEAVFGARARQAGARGYLMKEAGGDQLVKSIRAVLRPRNTSPRQTRRTRHWPEQAQGLPESRSEKG